MSRLLRQASVLSPTLQDFRSFWLELSSLEASTPAYQKALSPQVPRGGSNSWQKNQLRVQRRTRETGVQRREGALRTDQPALWPLSLTRLCPPRSDSCSLSIILSPAFPLPLYSLSPHSHPSLDPSRRSLRAEDEVQGHQRGAGQRTQ